MTKDDRIPDTDRCAVSRREFIKMGCTTVTGSLVMGLVPPAIAKGMNETAKYPVVDVAPAASLKVGAAVSFTYPDANSPALLIRLARPAEAGVGPGNSIVAYSGLCTHKGCPVAYRPERRLIICPCHWSSFDPAKAGQIVIGQASQSLPQISLRVRSGMVQAIGVDGLIYGRHTNIV